MTSGDRDRGSDEGALTPARTRGIQPPPNPAGPSNERSVTHGAYREHALAPLRAEGSVAISTRYPWLSDERVALLADVWALVRSTGAVVDTMAHPFTVERKRVDLQPVADKHGKLALRLERLLKELDDEADERDRTRRGSALDAHLDTTYREGGE